MKDKNTNKERHNAAATSIESFRIINNNGQRIKEKSKVLEAIRENQPVTSRMLSLITGIERTSICRALYDLVHDSKPQVKQSHIDKCFLTGRRVNHYSLIDWPQTKLFNSTVNE